jgi:ribosomal-protein-alanine N-acetyltransferase
MVDADVDAVLALDALVHPTTWSPDFMRSQLGLPDSRTNLVAELRGDLVGHAALLVVADEGHVTSVAVAPDQQRMGIGRVLLAALCSDAEHRGLGAMTLEVRVSNAAAIALYRRFGFAPSGVRPGYYADDGEDALIMWIHDVVKPGFKARVDEAAGHG